MPFFKYFDKIQKCVQYINFMQICDNFKNKNFGEIDGQKWLGNFGQNSNFDQKIDVLVKNQNFWRTRFLNK